jgi:hypothetical protein
MLLDSVEVNGGVERHVVMNDKLGLVSEMTLDKNHEQKTKLTSTSSP